MTFGWNEYWKPTPKIVRKIADAVNTLTAAAGTYTAITGNTKIGVIVMVVGYAVKIISNFFSDE